MALGVEIEGSALPVAVGSVLVSIEEMPLMRVLTGWDLDRILAGEARIAKVLTPLLQLLNPD